MIPLLTIITVTFNAKEMVEETIQSVLNQSFTNFEYWVIDGGSDDGTLDIVNKYSNKINIVSEKDYGIYHAMNKGITLSKGRWLYFLNAGDTLFDAAVLEIIFATPISDGVALIYGDIKTKNHPSGSNYSIGKKVSIESFYYGIGLCHQAAFTRRSAFETIGNYNYLEYSVLADQEWFVRYLKQGLESLYIKTTIANYEVVGISFLSRRKTQQEHLKIVSNYFSAWVILQNKIRSPWVTLKISLLQKFSGSLVYKHYRKIFFNN